MEDLTPQMEGFDVSRPRDMQGALGLGHVQGPESVSIVTEKRRQEKAQRYEKCLPISREILEGARTALAVRFRFLDRALWHMPLVASPEIYGIASDGISMYYDPEYVVDRFKISANEITRDVVHCLFHCIFRHPFMLYSVVRQPWDVACDIAIENLLLELLGDAYPSNFDQRALRALRIIRAQVGEPVTAERLYAFFQEGGAGTDLRSLAPLFAHDVHGLWYGGSEEGSNASSIRRRQGRALDNGGEAPLPDVADAAFPEDLQERLSEGGGTAGDAAAGEDGEESALSESDQGASGHGEQSDEAREEAREQWEDIARDMQVELETAITSQGTEAGNLIASLRAVNREKCDYAEFLRRFAVLRERIRVNLDEFDYIYYTFGLDAYGNMPLIEPLEYGESRAISDFVIAVDTSESCSGELVQAFVRKTFNILMQTQNFHHRVNVHIVQCDARVQDDTVLTSLDDLELYLESMQLRGFGGTDFRPVFDYVDMLQEKGDLRDLRGLVYFTDGRGEFPKRQPRYDVVFAFMDDGYSNPQVPPWALKVMLDKRGLDERIEAL